MNHRIFWITSPGEESSVSHPKAHLAYRISNGHLLRGPLPANTYGGMMAITEFCDCSEQIASELFSECALFGFRGVFAAVEEEPQQKLTEIFEYLGASLSAHRIPLIVPITYASLCKNTSYYASTSISGGSLQEYLQSLLLTVDASKLYLEHPVTNNKFAMPTLSGNGHGITPKEAEEILARQEVQAFYSPELFLNYCTYRENGEPHFLLFDDERTLRAKIELGQKLGVAGQFLLYRECKEFYRLF